GWCVASRRRHARLVSDWSSDVCSSDLKLLLWTCGGESCTPPIDRPTEEGNSDPEWPARRRQRHAHLRAPRPLAALHRAGMAAREIGRARVGKEGGSGGAAGACKTKREE